MFSLSNRFDKLYRSPSHFLVFLPFLISIVELVRQTHPLIFLSFCTFSEFYCRTGSTTPSLQYLVFHQFRYPVSPQSLFLLDWISPPIHSFYIYVKSTLVWIFYMTLSHVCQVCPSQTQWPCGHDQSPISLLKGFYLCRRIRSSPLPFALPSFAGM